MQIAAIAYTKLTPVAKSKVDALLKRNPDYQGWMKDVPADQAEKHAFVRASVWADDIKKQDHGYADDGEASTCAQADQNIGYRDRFMRKYWHYEDIPYPVISRTEATNSSNAPSIEIAGPSQVNAATEIKKLKDALNASEFSDDVHSYDLVWLLHLVGDAHQPLHAVRMFPKDFPTGDRGGNLEAVKPMMGDKVLLHSYWDALLGSHLTPQDAINEATVSGLDKISVDDGQAQIADPAIWFMESFELAKKFAYAEAVLSKITPVKLGPDSKPDLPSSDAVELTQTYEEDAENIARSQAALAGERLARILNEAHLTEL